MWADGPAVLGHRRLRIIDLTEASDQPFVSKDGKIALIYNGEIYNYRELRAELESLGHGFRSTGDTEVVMRAYQQWGVDCPSHFNGMFAFAIWDGSRKRLMLSRDRFGEKPLFYRRVAGALIFASEIKSILSVIPASPTPHAGNIRRYLATGDLDLDESTFVEGVLAVPAAHSLLWDASGRVQRVPYWQPSLARADHGRTFSERAATFRALMEDSVRLRLRSDVPLGSSLSGGIDSSAIVCLVKELSAPGLQQRTFTARFANHPQDEGHFVDIVARKTGAERHDVWVNPEGFLTDLPQLQWAQEAPFGGASVYAQWEVMKLAHQHNTTVLLDGQGADELLGGYGTAYGMYWSHLLYRGNVVRLARELVAYLGIHGIPVTPALYAAYFTLPRRARAGLVTRYYRSSKVIAPQLGRASSNGSVPRMKGLSRFQRMLMGQLTTSSLPELLRYADRNSMAFAREIRLPYLDHRLVEYAMTLPPEDLISGSVRKRILRQSMRGIVPDVVLQRKDKVGFEPPQTRWLRGPLKPWLNEMLSAAEKRTDIFRAAGVRVARKEFEAGGEDTVVWRVASVEAWFRHFLEAPGPPADMA